MEEYKNNRRKSGFLCKERLKSCVRLMGWGLAHHFHFFIITYYSTKVFKNLNAVMVAKRLQCKKIN